jgi:hypothetical protein
VLQVEREREYIDVVGVALAQIQKTAPALRYEAASR